MNYTRVDGRYLQVAVVNKIISSITKYLSKLTLVATNMLRNIITLNVPKKKKQTNKRKAEIRIKKKKKNSSCLSGQFLTCVWLLCTVHTAWADCNPADLPADLSVGWPKAWVIHDATG